MPETTAYQCKRKLLMIDNALLNATSYLYEYYYLLLRADLGLAASVEIMMVEIDETRAHLHDLYVAAWEIDHEAFESVGEVDELIKQARRDVLGRRSQCQAYSNVLGASAKASLRLLKRRAEAFSKPSN